MVKHGSDLMGLGSDLIEHGSGLVVGIEKKSNWNFYFIIADFGPDFQFSIGPIRHCRADVLIVFSTALILHSLELIGQEIFSKYRRF